MANLFYRNPRLTVLCVALILVAGLASLQTLPRQEDPTLARRFATITTFFPGATAERVDTLVTDPIEARILELSEVRELVSVSRPGVSVVQVELQEYFYEDDVDEIWSKVRDRLADARAAFPEGVGRSVFKDQTPTATTVLAAFVWVAEGPVQIALMSRLATELENRLQNLVGTDEVEIFGEPREEIRVTIDPATLAAAGLSVAQVAAAIGAADTKVPAGVVRHDGNQVLLELAGELDSLARVREVPLLASADGRLIRVGDIAVVAKTVRDPPPSIALIDGLPGVAVAATMQPDRRVDQWAVSARAVLDEFRTQVPRGIELRTVFDQSVYTEERLSTLVGNLVMAGLIVVSVLVFLMGLRPALVVATALPLTLLMALTEFSALGFPLHQTSITGLIIALGLLIDNAIVVVEEYSTRVRAGVSPGDAVAETVGELFVPLLASTVTTVLAFLPIILMPGAAGEFVGPISAGVGLSVASSFFLSMTVILALAGYLLRPSAEREARHWWRDGYQSAWLTSRFARTLDICLRRPWIGVAVSLILPLLGFAVSRTLVEQFFPANDRNQFQVQIRLAPQASLDATEAVTRRVRAAIQAHESVVESHWFIGEDSPRVYYNMIGAEEGISSFAGGFVTTVSAKATERLLPGLQRQLIAEFPEAQIWALPFEQGPPVGSPIEVRVFGPDPTTLRAIGDDLRRILSQTDGVTYTRAQMAGGTPKLVLRIDEDEARLAGLSLRDVAGRLQANLDGIVGATVLEGSEEIDVRVRVAAVERGELDRIDAMRLIPGGARGVSDPIGGVPVAAVADFDLEPQSSVLARFDGVRVNTVSATLMPYQLIDESLKDFRRRLAESGYQLPAGYRLEFGGEAAERSEALRRLAAFALPLFMVMAGTIILSFNSFRMALIIFVVAGLSVGLALLGVWMFGYPMGFVAIVGTMGLVGLAINDAIVVLTALRGSRAACSGDPECTRDVVLGATRHIVATTLTTIGGFVPLIYFAGRFWPPMATAIAGGVGGSSILALYLVPSMFIWMMRRDHRDPRTPD